jgi:hypothetical protein
MNTLTPEEAAIVDAYREAQAFDRPLFVLLLRAWAALSPGHRGIVYTVADGFVSAAAWRQKGAQ